MSMSIQFKIIYLVFSKKIYFFLFPYKSAGILDCPARIIFVAMIGYGRRGYPRFYKAVATARPSTY